MNSCVKQTDTAVEIIVVDDGSTDGTSHKLERFQRDSRVMVIRHHKNKGLSEVRKTGYQAANGKYLLFIDGDDWLEENAVQCLRQFAEDSLSDIICFPFFVDYSDERRSYHLDAFEQETGDSYLLRLLTGRIPTGLFGKLIRREYIAKNHLVFPPRLNCGEDVALAASLGMHSPINAFQPDPLYHYRVRASSLSAAPSKCMLDVLPATRFVKERLHANGLLDKYREEYEYYAFLHNLFFRFDAMFLLPNPYRAKLYENWLSLGIDISHNKYFIDNFSQDTPKNQLMRGLTKKP